MFVIAQAVLLARVITSVFIGRSGLVAMAPTLVLLLIVITLRAGTVWVTERAATEASIRVKSTLRSKALDAMAGTATSVGRTTSTGELTTIVSAGIESLDAYFARYLPVVPLAIITPVAVIGFSATLDWLTALILAVTLPVLIVFMILVGVGARRVSRARWRALQRLGGHFFDVLSGLDTLRLFGRSRRQIDVVGTISDNYRQTTMEVLRVAFLNSFVLELAATISTAIVAVTVGLRVVAGDITLEPALVVLILAPEVYLPIRKLGEEFHAAQDGAAAADAVFAVLDDPLAAPRPAKAMLAAPDPARCAISIESVSVIYPGRDVPALNAVDLRIDPGERLGIAGPNGAGKSTLAMIIAGTLAPSTGRVTVGSVDLSEVDPESWRRRIAWVPQAPYVFNASLRDNVALYCPDADDAAVTAALDAANCTFVLTLPAGLATILGDGGRRLSSGERQRLAVSRVVLADASLVIFDEPTANLDLASETEVVDAMAGLRRDCTVLIISHRSAPLDICDRVVGLDAGRAVIDITAGVQH